MLGCSIGIQAIREFTVCCLVAKLLVFVVNMLRFSVPKIHSKAIH